MLRRNFQPAAHDLPRVRCWAVSRRRHQAIPDPREPRRSRERSGCGPRPGVPQGALEGIPAAASPGELLVSTFFGVDAQEREPRVLVARRARRTESTHERLPSGCRRHPGQTAIGSSCIQCRETDVGVGHTQTGERLLIAWGLSARVKVFRRCARASLGVDQCCVAFAFRELYLQSPSSPVWVVPAAI
jgi:hypothetical protein